MDHLKLAISEIEQSEGKIVDIMLFGRCGIVGGFQYEQPLYKYEFFRLIVNFLIAKYFPKDEVSNPTFKFENETIFNGKYEQYRCNEIFQEICKRLFKTKYHQDKYIIKSHYIPFGKKYQIATDANSQQGETVKMVNIKPFDFVYTDNSTINKEKIMEFLHKTDIIDQSVMENAYNEMFTNWRNIDLPKYFSDHGISQHRPDHMHLKFGYYTMTPKEQQVFIEQNDYYINRFNAFLTAVDYLSLDQIKESVTLHNGDIFVVDHLIDLYELKNQFGLV